jgi:hypothetical protein
VQDSRQERRGRLMKPGQTGSRRGETSLQRERLALLSRAIYK